MSEDPDRTRRWLINASGAVILSNALAPGRSYAQVANSPTAKTLDPTAPPRTLQFLRSRSRCPTMWRTRSIAICHIVGQRDRDRRNWSVRGGAVGSRVLAVGEFATCAYDRPGASAFDRITAPL